MTEFSLSKTRTLLRQSQTVTVKITVHRIVRKGRSPYFSEQDDSFIPLLFYLHFLLCGQLDKSISTAKVKVFFTFGLPDTILHFRKTTEVLTSCTSTSSSLKNKGFR